MNPIPRVLAFDIFGTVVDWHGSIVREVQALYPSLDADAFALAWRAGYQPAMQRVRSGELVWTRVDELHRLILDGLLTRKPGGKLACTPDGALVLDAVVADLAA